MSTIYDYNVICKEVAKYYDEFTEIVREKFRDKVSVVFNGEHICFSTENIKVDFVIIGNSLIRVSTGITGEFKDDEIIKKIDIVDEIEKQVNIIYEVEKMFADYNNKTEE
jgi:hypothetical protein